MPTTLAVGQSVQLIAMVVLPDGTRKQTTNAVWASMDTSVATISSTGLLTVVGFGGTDVRATAYQQAATAHLRVPFAIAGFVYERIPTAEVPVPGARVSVSGGVDSGASTVTDSSGRFTLDVEAAGFDIVVSKDGYAPASSKIMALPRDQRPTIELVRHQHWRFTGGLCADWEFWYPDLGKPSRDCVASPKIARHVISVRRPGVLEIDFNWTYQEDYSAEYMWLEVRCGSLTVKQEYELGYYDPAGESPQKPRMIPSRSSGPLRVSVPSSAECTITVGPYGSFKGRIARTEYQVDLTYQ
jgi:hypothetical protein